MTGGTRSLRLVAAAGVLVLAGCSSQGASEDESATGSTGSATPTTPSSGSAAPTGGPTGGGTATSGGPTGTSSGETGGTSSGDSSGGPKAAAPAPSTFTPGNVHSTAAQPAPERTGTATLGKAAEVADGITARVTGHRSVRAEAGGPGETSGDAVALTVQVTNDSGRAVDLGSALVDLRAADGGSATPSSGKPADPLSGSLAAGRSASGTYVFVLPKNQRKDSTVLVRLSAGAVVTMKGDL